jgi:hypothetical protein
MLLLTAGAHAADGNILKILPPLPGENDSPFVNRTALYTG